MSGYDYGIGRDSYNYKYATPSTQPDAYNHYDPDHVFKPVYIDDHGKKRPTIAYTSSQDSQSKTDYYVSKAETFVEQRVKPPLASLGHSAVDLLKNRGGTEQKMPSGSSPFNPAKETTKEFFTRMHNEMNLTKPGPVGGATNWRQTPSSTGHGTGGGGNNNYYTIGNRPHASASDDWRHTPPSTGYLGTGGGSNNYNTTSNKPNASTTDGWRQTPISAGYHGTGGGSDNYNTTSNKPITNTTDDWHQTPSTGYYDTGGGSNNYNTTSNRPNTIATDGWRQTPPSTGYYGTGGGSNNYNTTGNKPNTVATDDWRQTPVSTVFGTGRGSNKYNTTSNRPNWSTTDDYNKHGSTTDPGLITSGGWARPNHETWATPPITSSYNPSTNDLSYSQKPSSNYTSQKHYDDYYRGSDNTNARLSGPDYSTAKPIASILKPSVPNTTSYTTTVETSDTASRYGSYALLSRKVENKYRPTPTIDSMEASMKYRGTAV